MKIKLSRIITSETRIEDLDRLYTIDCIVDSLIYDIIKSDNWLFSLFIDRTK